MINKVKVLVASQFTSLSLHDKLYKLGLYVLLIFGLLAGFAVVFEAHYVDKFAGFLANIVWVLSAFAFFLEYWYALRSLLEKKWVKWVGAGITYLVFRYSEVKAEAFINSFTGVDPSLLPNAVTLLTVFYLPYSWVIFFMVIITIYLVGAWIFEPAKIKSNGFRAWKFLSRTFGFMVIFFIAWMSVVAFDEDNSLIANVAKKNHFES